MADGLGGALVEAEDEVDGLVGLAGGGEPGYGGLYSAGYAHEPFNLSASSGDAVLRLPAIQLAFGLAKRWLLGTHHGAVRTKYLPAGPWPRAGSRPDPGLDDYIFASAGARRSHLPSLRPAEHTVAT